MFNAQSAKKMQYMRAFNSYFIEFMAAANAMFPDNIDIKTAQTSVEFIKKANPSAIVKAWNSHLAVPYGNEIKSGNFEFFTEKDYEADLQNFDCDGSSIMKIIDDLRCALREAMPEQKKRLFQYVQNLSVLSNFYMCTET